MSNTLTGVFRANCCCFDIAWEGQCEARYALQVCIAFAASKQR
jgi:hypothetical protein